VGAAERAIEVDGLVREFKKGPRAVDGIELGVDHGEIYGFLGPNGAGKSTTVLMLTTLLPPTAGTARVGGFDVVHEGPKVRRLAKDEGVTVFLTTQYLEEADVLADRVGIIDHGHIVAEGTPDALQAEIGRPTVEVKPGDPADTARANAILSSFGAPCESALGAAVRLATGQADLAGIVRALDAEGIAIEQLQLHQPTLDDVFLAKTGRSLEGSGAREEERATGELAMEPAA
jgi:ABC-type multidrug transport system ATPase subunit